MAVESSDDLAIFFELDDFGTPAVYTQTNKRPITINGIFDNPHASITATEMMDVTIPKPSFVCRTIDIPTAAEGDTIKINNVTYTVRIVATDGLGVTTLMMERN
jgi:hypothetical protein